MRYIINLFFPEEKYIVIIVHLQSDSDSALALVSNFGGKLVNEIHAAS